MPLLATKDPRYWLAKIVAEPDRRIYSRSALKEVADGVVKMNQAANAVMRAAVSSVWNNFWHGGSLDSIMEPFAARASTFSGKYARILIDSYGSDSVIAPDLKSDAIEMLTYATATIDRVRSTVNAEPSEIQTWIEGVSGLAASIYKALAGTVKAIVAGAGSLLTYAVIAVAGVWALGVYADFGRGRGRRGYF